ncbi:DUF4350 domain-containing protein [Allomuricauda sp. d1]|uniref:DUF4350 domain-containing protein n=1 Tax=Allomuricauda sp. d1 TaxID=3136725 RepID=UPI0031E1BF20
MDKKSKIILGIFCIAVVAIIVTEIVRPKPINWRPSYTATDKIPFGCFVLYSELGNLFQNHDIKTVEESVYDMMTKRDSLEKSNYLLINNYIYFDDQESFQLLDYVGQGNTVFIATNQLHGILADTLNVYTSADYGIREDTLSLDLTHPKFSNASFEYARGMNKWRFTSVDTANTTILGHVNYVWEDPLAQKPDEKRRYPNFIKTTFGKGTFYLSAAPEAFSNYYMLRGNDAYVEHAFSYLQNKPYLYWDGYKKSGRAVIDSPMRFVLNQAALKWTYYLTMVGLLLFVIFRARREQRIIPIIEPLKNSSVEFAQTVGALYHQNKDFTDIVNKKLNYFFEYLRSRHYVDTNQPIEKLIPELAAKSGKSVEETKNLMEYIHHLKNKSVHSETESIELSKKIYKFKH